MKKTKSSIKEHRPNKMNFRSNLSIYKEKFSKKEETEFRPRFSIAKNITFVNHGKIANNLAKAFKRVMPLKF